VAVIKRFETNMPACQHKVLCSPGPRVCDESPRGCKWSLQSHNLLPGGGVSGDRPHLVLHPVVMHLRHGRESQPLLSTSECKCPSPEVCSVFVTIRSIKFWTPAGSCKSFGQAPLAHFVSIRMLPAERIGIIDSHVTGR
jgi:hypothetical protein